MPFAVGERLLLGRVLRGGDWALVAVLVVVVLLIRFWPVIVRWFEDRR